MLVKQSVLGEVADVSQPLARWGAPAAVLVVLVAVLLLTRYGVLTRLRKRAQRTSARWDDVLVDVLASVRPTLLLPILLYAFTRDFSTPAWLDRGLHVLAVVCIGMQAFVSSRVLIEAGLQELDRRSRRGSPDSRAGLANSLTVLRTLLFGVAAILIVLAALDNMGVSITPLVTGLGIGGVAVALAVQSILGDLFGSLSIILDKPFVVGDFIVAGEQEGTVERIGIKTTRVRALSGEQLVFSNRDLLDSRIQNFKRMQERRVVFTFAVPYATSEGDLDSIVPIVQRAIAGHDQARFDRCHLKSLGEYALVFECVYFVNTPEYNAYMDIHQAINRALLREFRRRRVQFALYPGLAAGSGSLPPSAERSSGAQTTTLDRNP